MPLIEGVGGPQDTRVPVGTYVYGIADYGNIIAIASDGDHVDNIWYVWAGGVPTSHDMPVPC